MQVYPDCIACLVKFALDTGRKCTQDRRLLREICVDSLPIIAAHVSDLATAPPEVAQAINVMIKKKTGAVDPYIEDRKQQNAAALRLSPAVCDMIRTAPDPLKMALRVAALGNRMDSNFPERGKIAEVLRSRVSQEFSIDHSGALVRSLADAATLLILGDNAGEIVFDRLLIEEITRQFPQVSVTYVVKSGPVLNDVILDDARAVAMEDVATVITNGDDAPGTVLRRCSPELQQCFRDADVIISKGQGNYETLEAESRGNLFFLLQVKCPVIASDIGARMEDLLLYDVNGVQKKEVGGIAAVNPSRERGDREEDW
jgi:hypothetical protein